MGRGGRGHRGRGKPTPERTGPERTCCGCRQTDGRADLVRLTLDPEGQLFVDLRGKLGGRGAWVHAQKACVDAVVSNPGSLARSLRTKPDTSGLAAQLQQRIVAAALEGLSMAAAAGLLVGGRDLLTSALRGGRISGVVLASDAAERTVEGFRAAAPDHVPFVQLPIDATALGARVGKGPRAALGVGHGAAATHLRTQLRRLRHLG